MAPKTLLPLPSREHRNGGWSVDVDFLKAVQISSENILNDIDTVPSLEQIEAVLLAANTQFLRCWITAGGDVPRGGIQAADIYKPHDGKACLGPGCIYCDEEEAQ